MGNLPKRKISDVTFPSYKLFLYCMLRHHGRSLLVNSRFLILYGIYLCDLVLFLKLGDTSVMVTAVSKTKPSPSQFMPLVVCSLTLQ